MALEDAQPCIDILGEWGYRIKMGKTLGGDSLTYFSAPDQQRLADFQQMLDDDEVQAVFCARGGYGLGRIIDQISFKKFKKSPKWIIGFSDVTLLHTHIYKNFNIATMHAPMAAAFQPTEYPNEFVQTLKQTLQGRKIKYECAAHPFNRKGEAIGELVGGNLSLMAHVTGSGSEPPTKGRILFLEDVGEYLYNIDRMFYQLKRAGKLAKLGGLIIGGFTKTRDMGRGFGKTEYELILDIIQEYKYPVCFGFPVGHSKENVALKTGLGYKLKVSKSKVSLEE
jgi:muramoyltetrapeptide carboxypeptidase